MTGEAAILVSIFFILSFLAFTFICVFIHTFIIILILILLLITPHVLMSPQAAMKALDFAAVRRDLQDLMTTSQVHTTYHPAIIQRKEENIEEKQYIIHWPKDPEALKKAFFDFAFCPPLKMPTPKIPPWPDHHHHLCSRGGQQTMATMALSSSDLPGIALALSGNLRILKATFLLRRT